MKLILTQPPTELELELGLSLAIYTWIVIVILGNLCNNVMSLIGIFGNICKGTNSNMCKG